MAYNRQKHARIHRERIAARNALDHPPEIHHPASDRARWSVTITNPATGASKTKRATNPDNIEAAAKLATAMGLKIEVLELFYCCGPSCPGLPYKASDLYHPASCSKPRPGPAAVDPLDTDEGLFSRMLDADDPDHPWRQAEERDRLAALRTRS